MLYSYRELKEEYKSDYLIKKEIADSKIFKIEKGLYSNKEYVSELEIVVKKYPMAILTSKSAFYYLGLTDTIPDKCYLSTNKDATKIKDSRIIQIFENSDILNLGIEEKEIEGIKVKLYGEDRMLLELLRNKNKLPFDYYKEVCLNFRKRIDDMNIANLINMAERMPKSKMIIDSLQKEILWARLKKE